MTLETIFNAVMTPMGKDQLGGYFSPKERTNASIFVNSELFKSARKKYEKNETSDDTRVIVKTLGDEDNQPLIIDSNGYGVLPDDYLKVSSVRWQKVTAGENHDCSDSSTWLNKKWIMVEPLTDDQWSDRLQNTLKGPTSEDPTCTIQNNKLKVLPESIPYVQFTYLRKPADPFFDYNIVNGVPVYLPPGSVHDGSVLTAGTLSRSVEFEWTDGSFDDIVLRLVQYFSIKNRAVMPLQVSTAKNVKND